MKSNRKIALKKVSFAVLFFFSAFCMQPSHAQSQDTNKQDMQQLKDKLQQLEQMMGEVKGQIRVLEDKEATAEKTNGDVQALISTLDHPPGTPGASPLPSASAAQDKKPASESTMQVYGHVMADSGYNFGETDPNWFDVMRPTKLPAFAGEFGPEGSVFYSVRQTRFGVKTSTPTSLGDLKTIFEFELFGTGVDAGQTTFRLRHAWGELGHFGAGQYWSPFMDIDVFPNSLEYWGPNGMVFFRNIQFRWTPIKKDKATFMIAAERPGASGDGGIYSDRVELQNIAPQFILPDLSMQAHFNRKWGYLQVASMFRRIAWVDQAATPTKNLTGSAFGWGVNTSSNIKIGESSTARLQVVYGDGIQNYMNDAPIDIGVKNNFSNPISPIKGVALPMIGVVSFLDHNWNKKFSTSAGYSLLNIWNSNAEKPTDFHQGHYALVNLLFYPAKDVMMGGEFQYGRRVNFSSGFNYNDYRLQFSAKYSYSKTFAF